MKLTDQIARGTLVLAALDQLWLCPSLDCRAVSNRADFCPVCGATQLLSLAGLVDREEETEPA
jgi:hypothetical protein